MKFIISTNTYGNFDVKGIQSWIMKLAPGIGDFASHKVYNHFHLTPLISILLLFCLTLFLSLYKIGKDLILRKFIQWFCFLSARIGVLRVSGVCAVKRNELGVFPFLNCQACEMATGACPIGMIQWAIIRGNEITLISGILVLFGLILGRSVCGWLCPFGFISDILDKISIKKIKLPQFANYIKFFILFLIPIVFIYREPIFCMYICQSGHIFGRIPYYLTTGFLDFKSFLLTGKFTHTMLVFQLGSMVVFLILVILVSGRWFCRYLCPLGAFYGLFNYISPLKIKHNKAKCNNCNLCIKNCSMVSNFYESNFINTTNCIKCGKCKQFCRARKNIS